MANVREEIELLIKVLGAAGIADLKKKYEDLNTAQGELTAAFGQGTLTQQEFDEETKRNAKSSAELGKTLGQIEAALDRQARAAQKAADAKVKAFDKAIAGLQREQAAEDKATAQAEARATKQAAAAAKTNAAMASQSTFAGKYRQNLIALGYSANDFFSVQGSLSQRLNAIANNMPMLLAGFGGLGLALSGLLPIIGVVIQNWDNLKKAFGVTVDEGVTQLDRLEKRLKELKKSDLTIAINRKELDVTERQLERLKAALTEFRALEAQQSAAEHEAGQEVGKAIAEAGAPEIAEALKRKFLNEHEAAALAESRAQQTAAEQAVEDAKRAASAARSPAESQQAIHQMENAQKALAAAQEKAKAARDALAVSAETHVGGLTKTAKQGTGAAQDVAREQLAKELDAIGRTDLAKQIRDSSAAAVKWWKEAEETGRMFEEFMEEATREEKAAIDERKRIQQEALDELIRSKDLDAGNDAAAKAVNAKGLGALESFQALKDRIQQDILASLRKQGVDVAQAEAITARAAATEAAQAFERVGRAGQKQDKAVAAAQHKDETAQAKAEAADFDVEARRVYAQFAAEARRLQETFGQVAIAAFHQQAANNPQIAGRLAGQLSAQLQGFGATRGGANLAARQLAGRTGFEVGLQEIEGAQGAARAPRVARQPARRPRQVPAPRPATTKAGGFHLPTEAEVMARRARERKAQQGAQAGFRSIAPSAQQAPAAIPPTSGAAEGVVALGQAVERTQNGVIGTQQAVVGIAAALNNRCTRIEQVVATLANEARANRGFTRQAVARLDPAYPGNLPPGLS